MQSLLLVIPDKHDAERDAIAAAWVSGGGDVLRLGRFWEPPELDRDRVRLYGPDTFCLVLAQQLDLELVSPLDDLLVQVDRRWLQRALRRIALEDALGGTFPSFIKPVVPKVFRAAVYKTPVDLEGECRGLDVDTSVLMSTVVGFAAEARSFVLDGRVMTTAVYEGTGELADAVEFTENFGAAHDLPATCVIDVGLIPDRGWALIEANATWGSGLNGCDPVRAAKCIARATRS